MNNNNNPFLEIVESQKKILESTSLKDIISIINLIIRVLKNNKTVFWVGNGGSAAECQHMSAELIGRFKINRKPLKSISLTVDTSAISAISNDFGYEKVFSRQIEGLGSSGDVLVALSTSGNSKNIVHVLKTCNKMRIKTIAFLGNDGGKCKKNADLKVIVNSSNTARIQELHQILLHYICESVERELFKK